MTIKRVVINFVITVKPPNKGHLNSRTPSNSGKNQTTGMIYYEIKKVKMKLQLDNPSELEPRNKGQIKRIILEIYSTFLQVYFFIY